MGVVAGAGQQRKHIQRPRCTQRTENAVNMIKAPYLLGGSGETVVSKDMTHLRMKETKDKLWDLP